MQNIFNTTRHAGTISPRASETEYSFYHRYYHLKSDLKRHPLPFLALIVFYGHPFVIRQAGDSNFPISLPPQIQRLSPHSSVGNEGSLPTCPESSWWTTPFPEKLLPFWDPLVMEIDWTGGHLRFLLSMCEFANFQGISFHGGLLTDNLF